MVVADTAQAAAWSGSWTRPKGEGESTRYLFIGNVGPSSGVSVEELRDRLGSLGLQAQAEVVPASSAGAGKGKSSKSKNKSKKPPSHVFAAFGTPEDAQKAKGELAREGVGGKRLVLDYALYCPPRASASKMVGSRLCSATSSSRSFLR